MNETTSWQEVPISRLLLFQNGINASSDKYGKGIKYISVTDILNNNYITYECIKGLVDIDHKTLNNYSVTYGDILFQRSSEVQEDIGQSNVYLDKDNVATFGGFVIRGKKIGDYNPLFFNYMLKSPSSRRKIIRLGAGAQHYNIGQENLRALSFYFPTEQEQEKIGELFRILDERIATQIKIINNLESQKKYIINNLFKDGTVVKLNKLIHEINTKNKNNSINEVLSVNNKLGFIKQSDQFEDRNVASEDLSNYKIVSINNYAFNPARINVGSIARLKNYDCGIISPMYLCFKINTGKITHSYFDAFLLSSSFKKQLNKKLEGSVRQCITMDGFKNIDIILPSLKTQMKISVIINKLDRKLMIEKNYLINLKKQKQYLLSNMFV